MHKYDFDLDLATENSNSKIIKLIAPYKDVLEFGPAFGRMTRYLHDYLKCNVDIVELDQESGKHAAEFSRTACVGEDEGDIEKFEWEKKLGDSKYDYIIFADVLEHLHHPEKVLCVCKELLKEGGCILCSVPNVAHPSIIISLWNNDFTYNDVGLLDNTHVHFFTKSTFLTMVEQCGLYVERIEEISSAVGTNEIRWNYSDVPECVKNQLKFREEGEAYQYIYKLVLKNTENVFVSNCRGTVGYKCICYFKQEGDSSYKFEKSISKIYTQKKADIYYDLKDIDNIEGICVSIFPSASFIKILSVEIDGCRCDFYTNGKKIGDTMHLFDSEAQIFVDATEKKCNVVHLTFEVVMSIESGELIEQVLKLRELYDDICADNKGYRRSIQKKDDNQIELENNMHRMDAEVQKLEKTVENLNKEKDAMAQEIVRKEEAICNYENQKEETANLVTRLEEDKNDLLKKLHDKEEEYTQLYEKYSNAKKSFWVWLKQRKIEF